jgi:hypothetical protein
MREIQVVSIEHLARFLGYDHQNIHLRAYTVGLLTERIEKKWKLAPLKGLFHSL